MIGLFKQLRRVCPAELTVEEKAQCKDQALKESVEKKEEGSVPDPLPLDELLESLLKKKVDEKTKALYKNIQNTKLMPEGCAFVKLGDSMTDSAEKSENPPTNKSQSSTQLVIQKLLESYKVGAE